MTVTRNAPVAASGDGQASGGAGVVAAKFDAMQALRSPLAGSVAAVLVGLGLFLLTGWAAGQARIMVDWSNFRQTDALVFLGAYAQLVLAAAVFFQIRTANRAVARQVERDEQGQKVRQAEALLDLLAAATNARSLYVQAIPTLRSVRRNHGDLAAVERAVAELLPAEQLHQHAHAARVRVEAKCFGNNPLLDAAREITAGLDEQRRCARSVNVWSRNPSAAGTAAPDPQTAAVFPTDAYNTVLVAASALLGT